MHGNLVKHMCKESKKKRKMANKQDAYTCKKLIQ